MSRKDRVARARREAGAAEDLGLPVAPLPGKEEGPTISDLKAEAKKLKIQGYTKMAKPDLAMAIEKAKAPAVEKPAKKPAAKSPKKPAPPKAEAQKPVQEKRKPGSPGEGQVKRTYYLDSNLEKALKHKAVDAGLKPNDAVVAAIEAWVKSK